MPNAPKFTNRLAKEKSPYLLQHAHNPVDWYPWGEEAFKAAKEQDKPIFLSVGYSTCHWCHVMEHESFENEEVAKLMNEYFVNIKVDREERPNVDRVYMTFVQATTGHGGWPMSVWLTPDLKPIFGGTYYPPKDQYGRPGFMTLLKRIHEMWVSNRTKLMQSADNIIEQLQEALTSKGDSAGDMDRLNLAVLEKTYRHFVDSFDDKLGGFGGAPKFPTPVTFNFLLRYHAFMNVPESLLDSLPSLSILALKNTAMRYGVSLPAGTLEKTDLLEALRKGLAARKQQSRKALQMVELTLTQIARGGIHDHIGQGFHRYSVDEQWHVPHFEKMLYDQAQLLTAYTETYSVTKNQYYAEVARDIIQYVSRDLMSPEKGFYSAEDADSLPDQKSTHKKEGAFAVWESGELGSLLGEENAAIFNSHFGVKPNGNVNPRNDPHGELTDKNVLIQRQTLEETAKRFDKPAEEVQKVLDAAKAKLWEARKRRPKPHLDDKIIASWNGLMISALARAHQTLVLGKSDADQSDTQLLDLATYAAQFFKDRMYDPGRKVLKRSFREGPSEVEGFADDYAFLIQGLLDLYEAGFDERWLAWAVDLQEKQDELFWDPVAGGYFSGSAEDSRILLRLKEDHDGAEPAPSSVSVFNLLRLDALAPPKGLAHGTESEYRQKAGKTLKAFSEQLQKHPYSMTQMVASLAMYLRGLKEVVLHGSRSSPATSNLLRTTQSLYIPNRSLALADPAGKGGFIYDRSETFASIVDKPLDKDDGAEVFVCKGFECGLPVQEASEVVKMLAED